MNHAKLLHLSPSALHTHDSHIPVPLSAAAFAALKASILDSGIQRPLCVLETAPGQYTLLAGYNRWSVAKELDLATVPCVLVADLADPVRYMLDDNVTGRPNTKSSTALQVFFYYKEALLATAAAERKTMGLRNGSPCALNTHGKTLGISSTSLAERYDFSPHLLLDLETMYLACDPDNNEAGADAWGAICRAILEDEASIPRLKAGLAGGEKTKGKKRAPTQYGGLGLRSSQSMVSVFQHWSAIRSDQTRASICERLTESLRILPPEGFDAIAAAADSWNDHEIKRLTQVLKERLARK